jgi:DNA topoisomerase-2
MDGQNQASRKVLHGAMRYFAKNDNKPVKVAQLGGAISESESYHHGEASLFGSIKNRAFTATGGIQVVLFKPKGQYGFRSDGGVAASERYVYTALTKKVWDVLFNKLDYYLLSFREEDNTKLEPLYFVPIVPLVMLESKELPAHGWKLKIWARDVYAVIDAIKKYIEGNQAISALPPAKYAETNYPWTGEFRNIRGEPYSFGKYERYTLTDGRTLIRITELPLRVWTDSYMIWLKKQQEKYNFIESVVDCQSTTIVLIDITLSADGLRRIEGCGDSIWTDDIEEFFQLRNSMKSHINLMGIQGEVMEFRNYEEVLRFWLPKRERYYTLRIDRQLILLEIQIIVRENIIKYIEKDYTLKGMGRAKMDEFLIKEGFPPVNNVVLNSRDNFTKTEDLISTIMPDKMGGDADYKYLLNISDSNKSKESLENHYQKLAKYKKERDFILHEKSVDKFIGASTWKRELDELAAALREGGSTNWNFEEDSKYEL